jgi:enoyl-CoA hydratase/carnithine racemase
MVPTPTLAVPTSYNDLKFTTIQVSHHPASVQDVTPIILVTLYRPKVYNAFNFDMQREMEQFVYAMEFQSCLIEIG